jgi:hypothetical protein
LSPAKKNVRESTIKEEYQREIVFYTAGNKTYLPNVTGQDRLNRMALLIIHSETEVRSEHVLEALKKQLTKKERLDLVN